MALSATSRFVHLGWNIARPPYNQFGSFYYFLTDGTYIGHTAPYLIGTTLTAEAIADLAILKEIHESADGFLDADGNSVDILFRYGYTLAEAILIAHDPFDPDAYAAMLFPASTIGCTTGKPR